VRDSSTPELPADPSAPRHFTRRTLLAGAAALAVTPLLWANEVGRHELEVTQRSFFLRRLPPAFHGFRIVQFSDIHLEQFTEEFFLRHVVDTANSLQADLMLVTGDFISRGPLPASVALATAGRCAQILAGLTCPERYGVLGNHDANINPRVIRNHMEANGLPLLVNQHVRIERQGQHIFLGGLDDIAWGQPNVSESVPAAPDAPVILMCHEPDFADDIATHQRGPLVDLILSGHTHGGQVRLPGLPPVGLPLLGRIYVQGHFLVGSSQLYVNRGIGTVGLPFRLNCKPEITVLTLRPWPVEYGDAL
jgi:predicted MPP superfamily phosphohydrolase